MAIKLNKSGKPYKRPPRKGEGCPTSYKEQYCQEMLDYFESCKNVEKYEDKIFAPELPFFSKFARMIKVDETTLYEWKKKHPKFSQSFKACKAIQKELLQNYSLRGMYNPTIAKMLLNVNHGMIERKIVEHDGKMAIENTSDDVVVERLKEIEERIKKYEKTKKPV